MPTANVNSISINHEIDGENTSKDTIVLIDGLADDLLSWGFVGADLYLAGRNWRQTGPDRHRLSDQPSRSTAARHRNPLPLWA